MTMRNFNLASYVAPAARLALGGGENRDDQHGLAATFEHQELPLALSFHHRDYGAYARKIECHAAPTRALEALARLSGRSAILSRYSAERYQDQVSFRRSIAIERFEASPEKVARELQTHIIEPAKPAAFKALAELTDHAAQERDTCAKVMALCARHGLTMDRRSAGDQYRIWGNNISLTLYHSGDGRMEISGTFDSLAGVVAFMTEK